MNRKIEEVLNKIEGLDKDGKGREAEDHSLRAQAMERAHHLERPHAGTPHDWEDWEAYAKSPVPSDRKR